MEWFYTSDKLPTKKDKLQQILVEYKIPKGCRQIEILNSGESPDIEYWEANILKWLDETNESELNVITK